ncbi:hypothetical protein FOBRF1_006322 [Fusarium oxysporum]
MGDRRQGHPQSLSTSSTSLPYITNIFTLLLLYRPSIARPDLSIEAPWGLSSRQYIYTARLIAALKPHGGTSAKETREANISSALHPSLDQTVSSEITSNCLGSPCLDQVDLSESTSNCASSDHYLEPPFPLKITTYLGSPSSSDSPSRQHPLNS